ncbi:MAG TPA: hypothetical protein VMI54_14400 [Polyangiaceae bacterium]|nr:hypothetical protein [Polyangiaceae bacterium]
MNVTVAEVLAGAEARAVPLSAECVGYLVLAAADQVSAAPRRIDANDVLLFEDGGIRVASGRAADGPLAERDLRAVLDALLVRASAPTSGLLRASRRAPGGGVEALVRELETALIPVNRSAAKRSLARLERETARALQSGRISVPPPSARGSEAERAPVAAPPVEPVAPPPLAEIPELSVAPPATSLHERSTVPPPVAEVAPRRSEPHEPVAPSFATLAPPAEHTAMLDLAATTSEPVVGETVVLAPVAPKRDHEPELVETRPEPIVLRASQRPPAPPPAPVEPAPATSDLVRTEPLTFVRSSTAVGAEPLVKTPLPLVALEPEARPQVTPLLGTRVQRESELPPPVALAETATEIAADDFDDDVELEVAFDDDGDVDVLEVIFDGNEHTVEPADHELVVAEASELTEPCPPLAAESMLPPAPVAVGVDAGAPLEESIPLAVMIESAPPPIAVAPPVVATLTPPPRLALPRPRQSDVEDLLRRLEEAPLTDAELRSGLKHLAGMEPTPAMPLGKER